MKPPLIFTILVAVGLSGCAVGPTTRLSSDVGAAFAQAQFTGAGPSSYVRDPAIRRDLMDLSNSFGRMVGYTLGRRW